MSSHYRFCLGLMRLGFLAVMVLFVLVLIAQAPEIQEVLQLVQTGDYIGGMLGLQEDHPVITALIWIAHMLGNYAPAKY